MVWWVDVCGGVLHYIHTCQSSPFPPSTNRTPPTAQKQNWAGTLISEALLAGGSLCLFAIFVLIIIYWADLLKKVRTGPMCCD